MTAFEFIASWAAAGSIGGALLFRFGYLGDMVVGAAVGAPFLAAIGSILWLSGSYP